MFSSIGVRFYLGVFLLNCISMAANDTGLNLHCINDYDRLMLCGFDSPPDEPSCAEWTLNARVLSAKRYTERNCNLTSDPVRTGSCSCSLDINGFLPWEICKTTMWKPGDLVESKSISAIDNIKPKAPILTSVTREDENYLVTWDSKYEHPNFFLIVLLNYRKRGENGTEVDVSSMESYRILGKSLEPRTEYLVSVQSYSSFYSEKSGDLTFTTHTGLNLHCINDNDRLMLCGFDPPLDEPSCAEWTLNARVPGSQRYTERNCNLTLDPVRTGTCSCFLDINGFALGDNYKITLRKAGALVESKYISVFNNIKPKAPILTSVTRENENYLVTWDTKYKNPNFFLTVLLNYRKRGESGTEVDVSFMESYQILGKSLEPRTEYLVSVQSYFSFYSEKSGDLTFSTRLNLHCINDYDRLMLCGFNPPPDKPSCAEYRLDTGVDFINEYTERNCNLTLDPVRTGTCSCFLDINGFVPWEIYKITLWKAGALVQSKYISAVDNVKPKAPILTSVTREGGNYLVTWDTKYKDPNFFLTVLLNYRKRGENGTEVDVSFMEFYPILGKSLEPRTEYLVSVQSYSSFYSEKSGDLTFTTHGFTFGDIFGMRIVILWIVFAVSAVISLAMSRIGMWSWGNE
ncbi:uncharacterized protein LOC130380296 isoform X2 [Gadus chalcogrammus]|uniref:uncharacterized protein LOC130380296 isoform X2 n=1 Tax=Gadus chalcogrammus TaxID=1042646 RepID=UPI0024C40477|nr:uncharacterized protein LOC130380296 isoform X2 [Gadus chalcogrammus]